VPWGQARKGVGASRTFPHAGSVNHSRVQYMTALFAVRAHWEEIELARQFPTETFYDGNGTDTGAAVDALLSFPSADPLILRQSLQIPDTFTIPSSRTMRPSICPHHPKWSLPHVLIMLVSSSTIPTVELTIRSPGPGRFHHRSLCRAGGLIL
jgi:hypothetical protein